MTWVGFGGSYIQETTYKYVGTGAGDFELKGSAPNRMPVVICIGVVVLLLVLLLVILLQPITTTTVQLFQPMPKECLLWGDPHSKTFDGGFPNFYGEGEYWVVQSDLLSVQGRFLATPFTNGLAATHQIVVGGPIMENHKFTIGPMDNGQITCDDQPILQTSPSTFSCGPAFLEYNSEASLVDEEQGDLEKHVVHVSLNLGDKGKAHFEIFRWANHLNVRLLMPAIGQDGVCGNFNGDPVDDSTEAITGRFNGDVKVNPAGLLFREPTRTSNVVHKTIADCELEKREHAMKLCKQSQGNQEQYLMDACIFDVCFGGDQYAWQDGLGTAEEE
jgi:hypothetical protein